MTATSTCYAMSCGHVEPGMVATCPKCGRKMRSGKAVRVLGGLMTTCGLFLIGLMGTITVRMLPMLRHPGAEMPGGSRFTGTADQAQLILTLFAVVIAFGVLATGVGGFQLATGRRSRRATVGMLAFSAILFFVARGTRLALS
jgi:hypothetical protein